MPGVPAVRGPGTIGTSGKCGNGQRLGNGGRALNRYLKRHKVEVGCGVVLKRQQEAGHDQ